jgi:hypothetical protein
MIYPDLFAVTLAFTTAAVFLAAFFLLHAVSLPRKIPVEPVPEAEVEQPEVTDPTWKTLRITSAGFAEDWGGQPVLTELDDAIELKLLERDVTDATDTEASADFVYNDVVFGESVLAGFTGTGKWIYGVATDQIDGFCFVINGPDPEQLLWRNLLLLRGGLAEKARAYHRDSLQDGKEPPLKVLGKGTCTPDHSFWLRSGYRPWLFCPAWAYGPSRPSDDELEDVARRLESYLSDEPPEEGEIRRELSEIEAIAARGQLEDIRYRLARRAREREA